MSYYRELAFALRLRGLSETQIREVLDDAVALLAESGGAPETQFGAPQDYAGQFETQKRVTAGRKFTVMGVIFAVVTAGLLFAVGSANGAELRIGVISIPLGIAVVMCIVALIGGFMLDRRLPSGFRTPTGNS